MPVLFIYKTSKVKENWVAEKQLLFDLRSAGDVQVRSAVTKFVL